MAADTLNFPHSSLWPTREQYLWLLREEASSRRLLFTSKAMEDLPGDITDEEVHNMLGDSILTRFQWPDMPDFSSDEDASGKDVSSPICPSPGIDYANIEDSIERQSLIKKYAWLYLASIQTNVDKKLSEAGVISSCNLHQPEEAILHDLGALWSATVEAPPLKPGQAQAQAQAQAHAHAHVCVFSDIPQEHTKIVHLTIPFSYSFSTFQSLAASLSLVRYLTTKHHPSLAETLFHPDSRVYHHPYPSLLENLPPIEAPPTTDYDSPDRGWHSHVAPSADSDSMLHTPRDWRPINTEADWQSMLSLHQVTQRKVFMRHQSVVDRMDFVRRHREREEQERRETGGCYLNLYLERHMQEYWDGERRRRGPGKEDNDDDGCFVSAEEGDDWKRRMNDRARRKGEVMEDEREFFVGL